MKELQVCNNSIDFYILWCYNALNLRLRAANYERSAPRVLKKLLAMLTAVLLLTCLLPWNAAAASSAEEQRIRDQIRTTYRKTLSSSGRESLHGLCGVMAGWELYHLGVTQIAETYNGNDMYDMLRISDQISEGYTAQCYSAQDYSLEEALNAITENGTKDAYNIMVGFQWTKTAAGRLYGHVTVIHAVLNGNVYYTEGFVTPYGPDPRQAMVCTISEFADYYNSWTSFEGMIHFGSGNRIAGCEAYACDVFVAAQEPAALMTMPDFDTAEEVRMIPAGERLYATALCQNDEGVLFYRVEENGQDFFVTANLMKPVWFVYDRFTTTDLNLPVHMDEGERLRLSGVIRSPHSIYNTAVEITDENGNVVLRSEVLTQSNFVNLSDITLADAASLRKGNYTVSLYCDITNQYAAGGTVEKNMKRMLVASRSFTVGDAVPTAMSKRAIVAQSAVETPSNGWQYTDGGWYYYENNQVRTGWFCYDGVDYYLLEDGRAATGWQNINGKNRWFSETGAMRTGWLHTEEGCYYMLSNGIAATGLTAVEEILYVFDENGKMLTDTTVEVNGASYLLDSCGIATVNS